MTTLLGGQDLPRPAATPDAGPLDDRLYDLVETRVRRLFTDNPIMATYFGIHSEDHRLGDAGRDAVEHEIAQDKAHLAAVEALDPAGLSASARFERDLELHNVRLALFDADEVRRWERRSQAAGDIGDAVFALFARGAAPLVGADRSASRTASRACPRSSRRLAAGRSGPRSACGRRWSSATRRTCRASSPRSGRPRRRSLDARELARLDRAIDGARTALDDHITWLDGTLASATEDWPLGRERYDELVRLRAFGDLDADAILEIGWDQLRTNTEARRAAARELDPDADLPSVIERLKADHPATFEEALEGYKDAMRRSRAYLIEHDIATVPDDEVIEVIATPEYLRSVMPFAAYFSPARFDADQRGIYVVTPAVDNDPNAMLRALLGLDLEHQHPRGVPRPPPPARGGLQAPEPDPDAHRRPRVRRGLGHVLRADDARGGLRRRARLPDGDVHRRGLARLPDHPGRADAPRRAHP